MTLPSPWKAAQAVASTVAQLTLRSVGPAGKEYMTEIQVRPATRGDIDAIALVEDEAFKGDGWPSVLIRDAISRYRWSCFVATAGDALVGFISNLRPDSVRPGWMVSQAQELRDKSLFYVAELSTADAWRHKGVGHALLSHSIEFARTVPGITKVGLHCEIDNEVAIPFYKSHAFVVDHQVRSAFFGYPARLYMTLPLDSTQSSLAGS